jgi:hypothetical protein
MVWEHTFTQLKKEMENLQRLTVGFKGAKKTRRPGLSGRGKQVMRPREHTTPLRVPGRWRLHR